MSEALTVALVSFFLGGLFLTWMILGPIGRAGGHFLHTRRLAGTK